MAPATYFLGELILDATLYLSVSADFGGSSLLCNLKSSVDLRQVTDFQWVWLFLMKMGLLAPSSFMSEV